jgi:LPS export ABC transporter protein LptC
MKKMLGWLLVVTASQLVAACARTPTQPAQSTAAGANGPVYHISAQGTKQHPLTVFNTSQGQRVYVLRARSGVYATNLQQGTFRDNTLHFFKGAMPRLTVTAPVAVVDENSHNVDLSGGVVARTPSGESLTSDTMTYNEKTRLLTAVGHVVALDPSGYRLTGIRAIADLDLNQIRLFGAGPAGAKTP